MKVTLLQTKPGVVTLRRSLWPNEPRRDPERSRHSSGSTTHSNTGSFPEGRREKPKGGKRICEFCGKAFGKSGLSVHKRVGCPEMPDGVQRSFLQPKPEFVEGIPQVPLPPGLQCEHCDKTFASQARLESHILALNRVEECDKCGRVFKARDFKRVKDAHVNYNRHKKFCKGPNKCEKCGKVCKSAKFLGIHQKKCNFNELHQNVPTVRSNKCEFCGKQCKSARLLGIHHEKCNVLLKHLWQTDPAVRMRIANARNEEFMKSIKLEVSDVPKPTPLPVDPLI